MSTEELNSPGWARFIRCHIIRQCADLKAMHEIS